MNPHAVPRPMTEALESERSPRVQRSDVVSRLSVLSFATGLVLCCPPAGIVGVLAGGLALYLGKDLVEETSWRRFAWGGVALGCVGTILGLSLLVLFSHSRAQWESEGRVLFSGPNNALYALYQGNDDGFYAEFTGKGARPDEKVLAELKGRLEMEFGQFMYCNAPDVVSIEGEGPWVLGGYRAVFRSPGEEGGPSDFPCEIMVERLPSGTLRLVRVKITGDSGVVEYPSSSSHEVSQGG